MKRGPARFEYYLGKLEALMQEAARDHNPALYLYKNDARTPLFMLEALARIYRDLHNTKKFNKLKDQFKQLEDGLGQVDYYDSYANNFLKHPMVPVHIREYMQGQAREKIQHFNELLQEGKWLDKKSFLKLRKTLNEAEWLQPKEELKGIKEVYDESITKTVDFIKESGGSFTEMENQVHEFRRNIRWLSIYAQALRGCIQITDSGESEQAVKEYLQPEIVNSKFNIMPDADDNNWFLLLEKNYFYALSWMINELGIIKDEGLQYFAVAEALQQTAGFSKEDALVKSFEVFGVQKATYDQLLEKASTIVQKFMEQQCLENLVLGLARTEKSKS
ncbi:MAG: hypothetical protein EOP53_22450 [Sphingobacteriales bacterium]|nr:MAG: hypothetical protein EOP53_22450 [Sphingobacteriales bacterium]